MVADVDDPLADGILAKYYSEKVKENEKVNMNKRKIGFVWERENQKKAIRASFIKASDIVV